MNGEGVLPNPEKGLFEALLARKHNTVQSLQKTLGTLQWFSPFVPNFNYTVRSISRLLRTQNRPNDVVNFTPECTDAIRAVQKAVEDLPLHYHSAPSAPKEIIMTCGLEAFAVAIHQLIKVDDSPTPSRQILQLWSKRWCTPTENYNKADKLSLCVREVIKHFLPILIGSPSVTFFANDLTFVALANDPSCWSPRMHKYLAHGLQLNATYKMPPHKYMKDLDLLDAPIKDQPEATDFTNFRTSLEKHFHLLTPTEVKQIPIVHTDGGCITTKGNTRQGSIGIYWGPRSPNNVSRLAVRKPFTNQRAELEAILVALQQAQARKISHLILLSDSSYAVKCINFSKERWTFTTTDDGKNPMLIDAKGIQPKNSDIFIDILHITTGNATRVHTYFDHIPRARNQKLTS